MARAGGGQGTALCHGTESPQQHPTASGPWPLWAQPQLNAGAAPCLQEPQGTGEEQSYCRSSGPTAPPRWEQTPDLPHPPALDPVLCSPGSSRAPLVPLRLPRGSQHHQTPLSTASGQDPHPAPLHLSITGGVRAEKGGEGSPGAPRAEEFKRCPKTLCFSPPTQPPPAVTRSASPLAGQARRPGPLCVGLAF